MADIQVKDIQVKEHDRVVMFTPLTLLGQAWLVEETGEEAVRWCGSVVVESEYAPTLAQCAKDDGLKLQS